MNGIKQKTRDMAYIALFVVVMAVCAWITVPSVVPFTLQTLGVFLAVGILGGKRGTIAVAVYLLMGAVGLPVFSGFTGGIGQFFQITGGYLLGFLLCAAVCWAMEAAFGQKPLILACSMTLGLIVCYAFGTAWYMFLYAQTSGAMGIGTMLVSCVYHFVLPDVAKIALALLLCRRLGPIVNKKSL